MARPHTDTPTDKAIRDGLLLLASSLGGREIDALMTRACLRGLRDIPPAIVAESADRLAREIGRRFFPTVPEWLGMCGQVIAEQRHAAGLQAQALMAECVQCDGSDWERILVDGLDHVQKCGCRVRAMQLLEGLPAPLALPPAPESEPAA